MTTDQMTADSILGLFQGTSEIKMERYELGSSFEPVIAYFIYCEGMVRTAQLNEFVLPRIEEVLPETDEGLKLDVKMNATRLEQPDEIIRFVYSGELIVFFEKSKAVFAINISEIPKRMPQESSAEISVKGPRDAFVEELANNIALIRKRLRTASFVTERFTVGARSGTDVALLYIKDIANPEIVEEARRRIQSIDVDLIAGSGILEEWLADDPYSLFPLISYSTRPDFVADSLIRGRIAVLCEGMPTAVLAPTNLMFMLRSPEDAYFPYLVSTFSLGFRYVGLIIALLVPGFYIAAIAYNVDQIPFPLLATIVESRMGLPFPGPFETFLMVFMFEVFREAGERLPKAVGPIIAVVGGIVVGEAAIRAGLTSTTLIVITAITAVATFTLVNQSLVLAVSIGRLIIMIFASFLGMIGFVLGVIAIVLYFSSKTSFGLPFLAPLSPLKWKDLPLVLFRMPALKKNERPEMLSPVDATRQKKRSSK